MGLRPRGRDRIAHRGRPRAAPAIEARRRRSPHRDDQGRRLPADGRVGRVLRALRRRIAWKLTLVGFVGLVLILVGVYLDLALQSFATEALEARLATAARLLHDEARALVVGRASPTSLQAFAIRASQPTASRVSLIAADGRVL